MEFWHLKPEWRYFGRLLKGLRPVLQTAAIGTTACCPGGTSLPSATGCPDGLPADHRNAISSIASRAIVTPSAKRGAAWGIIRARQRLISSCDPRRSGNRLAIDSMI